MSISIAISTCVSDVFWVLRGRHHMRGAWEHGPLTGPTDAIPQIQKASRGWVNTASKHHRSRLDCNDTTPARPRAQGLQD